MLGVVWVDSGGGVSWVSGSGGGVGVPGRVTGLGAWLLNSKDLGHVNAGVLYWWSVNLNGGGGGDHGGHNKGSEHFDD